MVGSVKIKQDRKTKIFLFSTRQNYFHYFSKTQNFINFIKLYTTINMSNIPNSSYGAANGTASDRTGSIPWGSPPLKEGSRLGDAGVDFVDWERKTRQEAQLRALHEHIYSAPRPDITRAQWGGADTFKVRLEIEAENRKMNQGRIGACELMRGRLAPNSDEMSIVLQALDEGRPFDGMSLLQQQCNKRDYGKLVERFSKLFKPSKETTTQGMVNETRRLLDDITDLGMKLPPPPAADEDGNEEEVTFTFPSCVATAIALSRSMEVPVNDIKHQQMGSKVVKEISFRYPNAEAIDIGSTEFHEVIRVIIRAETLIKPEATVNVFEVAAQNTIPLRLPFKNRSANAKPDDNCEIHPMAKIPHTNKDCRQNQANVFKLKFKKRKNEGGPEDQGISKQKIMLFEESLSSESSDIDEIYLSNENFHCGIIGNENDMSPFNQQSSSFPNNLFIEIPRLDERTTKPVAAAAVMQLCDENQNDVVKTYYPLTYEGLLNWNKNDQRLQSYNSSSEEEDCYSSDCEDLVNDEQNFVEMAPKRRMEHYPSIAEQTKFHATTKWYENEEEETPYEQSKQFAFYTARAEFLPMREKEEVCVDQFMPKKSPIAPASVLLKEVEEWEWGLRLDDDKEPETESQSTANELMFFNWGDDYDVNPNGGWERKREEEHPDKCEHSPDGHEEEECTDDSEYSDGHDEDGHPEGNSYEVQPLVSDSNSDDENDIDYI